jgi:hypothetical protein
MKNSSIRGEVGFIRNVISQNIFRTGWKLQGNQAHMHMIVFTGRLLVIYNKSIHEMPLLY